MPRSHVLVLGEDIIDGAHTDHSGGNSEKSFNPSPAEGFADKSTLVHSEQAIIILCISNTDQDWAKRRAKKAVNN